MALVKDTTETATRQAFVTRSSERDVTTIMPDFTTDKPRKRDRAREDTDHGEHKHKKGIRYKGEGDHHKRKKHKRQHEHSRTTEEYDEDEWIEKNIDGETVCPSFFGPEK